ncbi:hypothetical protein DFJ74DRAFT_270755 [Hyaloraphidium curvatum]|nr:hypothetical protein DFJ74DRAFT_270755 [Hyaloraphidium curvatum]
MIRVVGLTGEALVLDGSWVEKLRGGYSVSKVPADSVKEAKWEDITRRKNVLFGPKETIVQVLLSFSNGPFLTLQVPEERRAELYCQLNSRCLPAWMLG